MAQPLLNPNISRHLRSSPTLRINEQVQALWEGGQQVYHFGFGESRFPVHPRLQRALSENSHRKDYLPVQGLPELREAIASYYGRHLKLDIDAGQVIIGPGSKALLFALTLALAGELILPVPSWVSYAPQAHLVGKRVRRVHADPKRHYTLTIEALGEAVRQSDSAVTLIINSPNNPAGYMFSGEFLRTLADYCRQQGILVISDEIYGLVPHAQQAHISLAGHYPEGTIILGGLSKHLSLGGWRLGMAIIPKDAVELMAALKVIASETWSAVSAPIQHAAITAYSYNPEIEAYIRECAQIHAVRSHFVWEQLTSTGVSCAEPQGGFYLFPNFDRWRSALAAKGVTNSEQLAAYLLEHHHIAALPGMAFGAEAGDLALRFSTSYLDMESEEAVQSYLRAWRSCQDPELFLANHQPNMRAAMRELRAFITDLGAPTGS